MGMFDGMNQAPMGLQRLYFQVGRYLIKVIKIKGITAAESFHGRGSFVVECEILKSTVPGLPPGSQPAWVQTIGQSAKDREMAFGAIKLFFAAVLNDPKLAGLDVESLADNAVSDANPLCGAALGLVCTNKRTKAGGDFTLHAWHNAEGFMP